MASLAAIGVGSCSCNSIGQKAVGMLRLNEM